MVVAITAMGLATYAFRSIINLFARRIDGRARPAMNPETEARIARIEQAVDAIAVEVERISEGQRFTTRLLSERAQAQPLPSGKPTVQS
jgi:hypothetical protein